MLGQGEPTPYYQVQELTVAKEPYEKLWQGAVKFHRYYEKWMNGPLLEVNAEEVEEEVGVAALGVMMLYSHVKLQSHHKHIHVHVHVHLHVSRRCKLFGRTRTS